MAKSRRNIDDHGFEKKRSTWVGWSASEDEFVLKHYKEMSVAEMALALGRTVNATRNRRSVLGCIEVAPFTEEEIARINGAYGSAGSGYVDLTALAIELGRDKSTVCAKAAQLGLTDQTRKKRARAKKNRRKTATPEELRRLRSETTARRHRENGHPMRGRQHSPETRRRMSAAIKKGHSRRSSQDKADAVEKSIATKVGRYGRAGGFQKNPYSRCIRGRRDDIGPMFFRSSWEANYARYLNVLLADGAIAKWTYESKCFVFPNVTRGQVSFLPDFEVTLPGGGIEYHEVKGWMNGKSRTKLKRMKKYYPEVTVIVIDATAYRRIEAEFGRSIPKWEWPVKKNRQTE